MRNRFIAELLKIAREDERVWLITPDLGYGVLESFAAEFPERFLNAGIAEQNAVGMAAGLAMSGKIPCVYSIAPFVWARPFEQVRVDCAYQNLPVRLVGVGGGVSYGALGATHHSIEDIAVMRSLPNMQVFAPGSVNEAAEIARHSARSSSPMYIHLGKKGEPEYSYATEIGKLARAAEGTDFTIIAMSTMLAPAVDLARKFSGRAEVWSAHTMKPFDSERVAEIARSGRPIITLEEHNIIGGLGSCVLEAVARAGIPSRVLTIAIPDEYSHIVGSQEYIRERLGLGDLERRIREFAG